MKNARDRRLSFRAILESQATVFTASVYDPMSARIAEDLGYEVGMLAGSVASMTVLGAPDIVLLTLTEFAEQCRRISRASALPLLVDADHGYGNALNVMRTIEELDSAGVAALTIEDTELPASFGGKSRLISLEEGVGKMKAAVAARANPELVIVGRTSLQLTGLEDAVARARAYEAAGVDSFYIVGVKTRAELDAFYEALRIPIILGNAPGDLADLGYLASRRVRMAQQGHLPIRAAAKAIYDTLQTLRAGNVPVEADLAPPALMRDLLREDDYERGAKNFM